MRAAFMPEPGRIQVGDFPEPEVRDPGDLLVRMELASICGSDLHTVYDGFHNPAMLGEPGYPGHEGIGVVEESLSPDVAVGDRVLTLPPGPVGTCFAQRQVISASQCLVVPPTLSPERALMAQQLGTALYAWRLFWPDPERLAGTCAIIGAGSAGLYLTQLARRAGFGQVIVSDLNAHRLAVARELGADRTVLAPDEDLVEAVTEATGGEGADLVIEAAGYDACRSDAVHAVAYYGTCGFFGFPELLGDAPFPHNLAFRKVARIQWAGRTQHEPGLRSFQDALHEIAHDQIRIDHCLGTPYPLEATPRALEVARAHAGEEIKLQIDLT